LIGLDYNRGFHRAIPPMKDMLGKSTSALASQNDEDRCQFLDEASFVLVCCMPLSRGVLLQNILCEQKDAEDGVTKLNPAV